MEQARKSIMVTSSVHREIRIICAVTGMPASRVIETLLSYVGSESSGTDGLALTGVQEALIEVIRRSCARKDG